MPNNFSEEVQDFLTESESLSKVFECCDEGMVQYIEGVFLSYNIDVDLEDPKLNPARFLYNLLIEECEMSDREAAALLDNAVEGLLEAAFDQPDPVV